MVRGAHKPGSGALAILVRDQKAQNPPLQILDIGCGTGAMSVLLQSWGEVVSADFSPLALMYSERRGLKHLVHADAMNLPFEDNSFDLLVAMDLLEHIPDDNLALSEFCRVLKPGGRIILTVPAYAHLWSDHDVALMHFRRYTRQVLRERFIAAGFKIQKLSHTMTMLYPVVALQRRINSMGKGNKEPKAAMPMLPGIVNRMLISMLNVENSVARRVDFPVGVTILCTAQKPGG